MKHIGTVVLVIMSLLAGLFTGWLWEDVAWATFGYSPLVHPWLVGGLSGIGMAVATLMTIRGESKL